jgi:hypothetical protein
VRSTGRVSADRRQPRNPVQCCISAGSAYSKSFFPVESIGVVCFYYLQQIECNLSNMKTTFFDLSRLIALAAIMFSIGSCTKENAEPAQVPLHNRSLTIQQLSIMFEGRMTRFSKKIPPFPGHDREKRE